MNKELILKRCLKCGALVEILKDSEISCCGEPMKKIMANSVDAAFEKHVPNYEVNDGKITVKVNHVMEEEHYIEWIAIASEKRVCKKFLKPGDVAEVCFKYIPGSKIYAYCNKHGLWSNEVK